MSFDIEHINDYINYATVVCAIIGFIYALYDITKTKREIKLEDLLVGAFGSSTIPTGVVLILSAFDPSVIQKIQGLNVHFAAAGLALLYIAFKSFSPSSHNLPSKENK